MIAKSSSMNEKAREVEVTRDFLSRFFNPLWDKLDLQNCKALSAIEGGQNGYRSIILELEHLRFGLLAENGERAITTFFIVAIPESFLGRHVSWHPIGCQVSTDRAYAYLARPGKQVRPKEWRHLIQATIKTVESLKTSGEVAGSAQAFETTNRPVGAPTGVYAFWAVVAIAFAFLLIGTGLAIMFGIIDYRPDCFPNAATPRCKITTAAWQGWEAFKTGGEYLLGGGFCIFGALSCRERVRKRLRSQSD